MIRPLLIFIGLAAAACVAAPGFAQVSPAASPAGAPPGPDVRWLPSTELAVLQALDKITGHVRTVDAPVGQTVRFGTLEILVHTCRKRPPEDPPESAAFLEVTDVRPGEPPNRLFTGWMFASSPAVSALEDPVYDVWVIDCKKASGPAPKK